ncbi:MAG: bifunctional 4-hydroxy-3-methylbut-2-enyl diphosphate reductase/30S ribosomal protein S1 [Syntrophomonadaceae bacterium]|nr:bifunctional 4-hydroxy-3-methylbut-2-enyl diphosphate reductase/30S ribosomal protein S1 [Syntrophomonadaceae bacterium]MDD3888564.1 bifunctional 4-hydroxy-3-methylbut-2-enyl diphosphate reductase/30S ribosomal protein S1 [Syntrophomonadaceae bacterium]MDD4548594.1 bifunctional 4-hydroxy-3-methylbut-2-enyl diphosphate reductase/30S ribosomal protein S1 [Syntrophomonadaceae bacterium]
MQAKIAKHAGFCAGVRRAVKIAEGTVNEWERWYSLGPLVHNHAVINYFTEKGISSIERLDEITAEDCGVIIRAHGTTPDIVHQAEVQGLKIKDATCHLVKRVHEIVASLRGEAYEIVVFGDANHPEVQGIVGWSDNTAIVVASPAEACEIKPVNKLGIISQTTKDEKDFFEVVNALLHKSKEIRVFNTICSATKLRQQAARELCREVDLMLVVGDQMSSNTATLKRECATTGVPSYQIQDASELESEWFKGISTVGITAGASTPDWIIKEVLDRMTEYEENQDTNQENEDTNQENQGNEELFAKMEAEMAEYKTPSRGDVIKGTVIQVLDDEVMVDVGGKSEGIIPLREMSLQDVDSAKELVNVGDEIEVLVLKWDDDGTILLSKKKVDSKKVLDELEKDYNNDNVLEGTVTGSVKGGLLVDVGITAFLPASHVDDGYVKNLDDFVGQTLKFKIIEFNRNKRRGSQIVVSRRELVVEEKERLKKEFWETIEEGQTRTGKVKRIVDYGAFIDLGGFEGLLHVSEIDHKRVEHPADVLTEGQELDVFILGLDREKSRVSLSRKKLLKSPWEIALEKYHEGDIIDGTVVRIAPFGAFVEIDPGVDGLVHISQLANHRVEKPEDVVSVKDEIKVKVISIDPEGKRIGLSLKEALNDAEQEEVEEYLESQDDNTDY